MEEGIRRRVEIKEGVAEGVTKMWVKWGMRIEGTKEGGKGENDVKEGGMEKERRGGEMEECVRERG